MKTISNFMLPENTNQLYKNEAISSISLTRDVAEKINELVSAYNELSKEDLEWKQEQDGRTRKAILYMKDNLVNSLHDLMEQLKDSGFIDGRIFAYMTNFEKDVTTLAARLDNLLGTVTTGSTTMDAEIIDGRLGANNQRYGSVGEATRKNIKMVLGERVGNVLNLRLNINLAERRITLGRATSGLSVIFGEKKRYHFPDTFNTISLDITNLATSTYNVVFNGGLGTIRLVELSMMSNVMPEYNHDDFILATLYMGADSVREYVYIIDGFVYENGVLKTLHHTPSEVIGTSAARIEIDAVNKTIAFPSGIIFFDKENFVYGSENTKVSYSGFVDPAGETIRVVYENGNLTLKKLHDVSPNECLLMLIWFGANETTYENRVFANAILKNVIYFNGNKIVSDVVSKRHYNSFSVLGDSYSSFDGYMDPETNRSWYPSANNDVKDVTQCWWYKFANEYQSALIQNNSFTGSVVSYDGYGTGTTDGQTESFVTRVADLKHAELLIIFGATNDSSVPVAMGNYKYSGWVDSDFETFRPSLAYLLDHVKKHHAGTKILYVLNNGLSADINTSVETICNYYGVDLLKLTNIDKQDGHPSIAGMEQIKNQIIAHLNN